MAWILAIGGSEHDSSVALIEDHDIKVVIEQERLSRRKHGVAYWFESPVQAAIDYCLSSEGVSMSQIKRIVASDTLPARVRHDLKDFDLVEYPHHHCHAASAYLFVPPKSKAGIIVYDGFGSARSAKTGSRFRNERETISVYIFTSTGYECVGATYGMAFVENDEFPIGVTNSIGMLFEMVTGILGYDLMDCGKTMGLASYGSPQHLPLLKKFCRLTDEPNDWFKCETDNPELAISIQRILDSSRNGFSARADLASSLQALANEVLLHSSSRLHTHEVDYLCVAGGCGLNTTANSYLQSHYPKGVPIIIPPHCGDSGLGLGAAWLDSCAHNGRAPSFTFRGGSVDPGLSRPGKLYSKDDFRTAVQQFYPRLVHDGKVTTARHLAELLANGEAVGVFNGRSEIGPRALGGRSIFADPRSVSMRERINREIKRREPYRPLAPMVLASEYENYFEDRRFCDRFMLKVSSARPRCLMEAPAVVHVDGTARVQIIDGSSDPFLEELLQEFRQITGVGLLLNTSFNRRGEPIVESPIDAIDAFLGMGLDGLYLNGDFYRQWLPASPNASTI